VYPLGTHVQDHAAPIVCLTLALASAVAVSGCSKVGGAKAAAATADGTAGAAADGSAPAGRRRAAAAHRRVLAEGVVLENKIGKRLMNVRISVEIKESAVPFVVVLPALDKETRLLVDWLRSAATKRRSTTRRRITPSRSPSWRRTSSRRPTRSRFPGRNSWFAVALALESPPRRSAKAFSRATRGGKTSRSASLIVRPAKTPLALEP